MKIILMLALFAVAAPTLSFADETAAPGVMADEALPPPPGNPDRFPPRPPFRTRFQCTAVNFLRQRFTGRSFYVQQAQREALMHCERSSFLRRGCHLVGCFRVRF